jgi:hypothetical protein
MAMKKSSVTMLTRAVTHIPFGNANSGKLAALDVPWDAYKELFQTALVKDPPT